MISALARRRGDDWPRNYKSNTSQSLSQTNVKRISAPWKTWIHCAWVGCNLTLCHSRVFSSFIVLVNPKIFLPKKNKKNIEDNSSHNNIDLLVNREHEDHMPQRSISSKTLFHCQSRRLSIIAETINTECDMTLKNTHKSNLSNMPSSPGLRNGFLLLEVVRQIF